jgi:hypothetical protein
MASVGAPTEATVSIVVAGTAVMAIETGSSTDAVALTVATAEVPLETYEVDSTEAEA